MMKIFYSLLLLAVCFSACTSETNPPSDLPFSLEPVDGGRIRTAAFVVTESVFNSELMAPYDIFQHSVFRDSMDYIQPFIVAPSIETIRTFEGIDILPHYSFETAPKVDILVIPSTNNSMSADLKNQEYIDWIVKAMRQADYVITLCDGAFALAATGALDGRIATTFPGDREAFQEMYPAVSVQFDVRLVRDNKYITSVGGGMSYEPALYLMEMIYSKESADKTAEGLVWDWNLEDVPHRIAPVQSDLAEKDGGRNDEP